jgi:hypothetical protein
MDFRKLGGSSINEILHTYISNLSSGRSFTEEDANRLMDETGLHNISKSEVPEITTMQLGKVMEDLLAVISYGELQIISSAILKESITGKTRNIASHELKRSINGIESFRLLGLTINVGPGISTTPEMLKEHPYLKCSISENTMTATLLEMLIFAGWIDTTHGYINISAELRESSSGEYLDILNAETSIEKAEIRLNLLRQFLTPKASDFALESVKGRSRKLDSENLNIRDSDLQGSDYWLRNFSSNSRSGRD